MSPLLAILLIIAEIVCIVMFCYTANKYFKKKLNLNHPKEEDVPKPDFDRAAITIYIRQPELPEKANLYPEQLTYWLREKVDGPYAYKARWVHCGITMESALQKYIENGTMTYELLAVKNQEPLNKLAPVVFIASVYDFVLRRWGVWEEYQYTPKTGVFKINKNQIGENI